MARGAAVLGIEVVALAAAYVAVAQVGLGMARGYEQGLLSPDWITTGLAVGALALWGERLWPGIALGAFIAYGLDGCSPGVAAGIAVGNAMEALLGAWLLRGWGVVGEIRRIRDVLVLVATALVAPMPSATGGVLGPSLAGMLPWGDFGTRWGAWWVGDAVGIVLLAPPMLAWGGLRSPAARSARSWEAVAVLFAGLLGILVAFVGQPVFAALGGEHMPIRVPIAPFVFPPMVWAAVRLPPRKAVVVPAVMALLAIWLTYRNIGPVTRGDPLGNMILVQLIFGSMVGMALVLIGAVAQFEEALTRAAWATRQAEEAMRQAQDATRRAEEASSAKSRFVAAVRHDLAQPLQAVRLFLASLSTQPLDARGRLLVERVEGAAEAMGAALDALKDITAVECELVRADIAEFPVGELLAQLADEWRPQAEDKGLQLRFVPCHGHVLSDRQMLGRIFRNLLANAVRYTSRGRVLLGCRYTPHGVRIEVWDTGPGIPSEEHEAIFEAFHRAPGAEGQQTPGEPKGLGLGLATVRRLSAALGLTVAVRSTVGKGSVFSIEVPRPSGSGRQAKA